MSIHRRRCQVGTCKRDCVEPSKCCTAAARRAHCSASASFTSSSDGAGALLTSVACSGADGCVCVCNTGDICDTCACPCVWDTRCLAKVVTLVGLGGTRGFAFGLFAASCHTQTQHYHKPSPTQQYQFFFLGTCSFFHGSYLSPKID